MTKRPIWLMIVLLSLLLLSSAALNNARGRADSRDQQGITLVRPVFAQTGSFLDVEAGIAAYIKVDGPINLEKAKSVIILPETDGTVDPQDMEHVIGTVEVDLAPADPHVFVSEDGWLIAYFMREQSIGNAWPFGHGIKPPNDVLSTALSRVASAAGLTSQHIPKYYDFEFPSANKLMVINAPNDLTGFTVKIPSAFNVFEAANTLRFKNSGNSIVPGIRNVTTSIKSGEFQTWIGSLIIVYQQPL